MEVVALPSSGSEAGGFLVGDAELLRILNGVFEATNTPKDGIGGFKGWIACQSPLGASWNRPEGDGNAATTWLSCWKDMLRSTCFDDNPQLRLFVSLALVVAYLRLKHRQSSTPDARDIGAIWEVTHQVFTSDQFDPPLPNYFCRAHGYYVVPFCSLEAAPGTGDIELYRVHVWLPDDRRRDLDSSMYCCRCKTQSLVFVGEGVLKSVEGDSLAELATHNEFLDESLSDEGSSVSDRVCSSFQKKTLPLQAAQIQSHFHLLNTSYKVDGELWHTLEVPPDTLRADLVVFRGGSTINPRGIEPVAAQVNRPESSTASLAFSANAVRSWQMLHEEGKYNARRSEMEEALRIFNKALSLCENFEGIPNSSHYANLVHAELGFVNRCLGRYEVAEYHLREALKEPQLSWCRLKSSGELGTVYRAMNRLHEAKVAFETQYEIAQQLDNQSTLCRAVGNLGMINYQLFLRESDAELLGVAVTQLKERVDRGRRIEEVLRKGNMEAKEKAARLKQAAVWISIGLNRLSLCYTVQGKTKEAVEATREAQTIKILPEDPTVMAMSHFFYARALWHDGQREAALRHFNPPLACTPAIALCKEPSEENLEYLKELVEAGVDMSRIDEYGYSALDYTVFGQDLEMEALVIKGLRETEGKIEQIRTEASLWKGYRELFQDKMRPVLLGGGVHALQKLRLEYASTLTAMNEKSTRFDTLKYLRYPDFLRIGRLPRHSDGFTRNLRSELRQGSAAEFIIFVSYRWINTINQRSLPDDEENSQYKRMVVAVNEFLHINPQLDPDKLGIWLDYACIDQDDPIPGVTALPMLLAQCDVVISLVDEIYYNRAWCAIEAFLVQTLRESYSIHEWYEHVPRSGPTGGWMLRPGPFDMGITPGTKALSYEEDRPKILFLERQTKLLRDAYLIGKLALRLGKAFTKGRKSAPAEFREVENQLYSLSTALCALQNAYGDGELHVAACVSDDYDQPSQPIATMLENCRQTLQHLEAIVEKFGILGDSNDGIAKPARLKRWSRGLRENWTKIQWTTKGGDLATLQRRLAVHTNSLNLVLGVANNVQGGRIESQVAQIKSTLNQIFEWFNQNIHQPAVSDQQLVAQFDSPSSDTLSSGYSSSARSQPPQFGFEVYSGSLGALSLTCERAWLHPEWNHRRSRPNGKSGNEQGLGVGLEQMPGCLFVCRCTSAGPHDRTLQSYRLSSTTFPTRLTGCKWSWMLDKVADTVSNRLVRLFIHKVPLPCLSEFEENFIQALALDKLAELLRTRGNTMLAYHFPATDDDGVMPLRLLRMMA